MGDAGVDTALEQAHNQRAAFVLSDTGSRPAAAHARVGDSAGAAGFFQAGPQWICGNGVDLLQRKHTATRGV